MEIDDFLKNVVGEQQSVLPRGFNVSTIPCVPETSQDNMPHGASVNQSTFMPEFIYKYCKKTDFDKYYSKGIFQLGSLKKYRDDYEKDYEYADPMEGQPTYSQMGPIKSAHLDITTGVEGVMIIDIDSSNAYAFCVSEEYSKDMHKVWFEREGCEYDLCLKIDAKPFLSHLIRRIKHKISYKKSFYLNRPVFSSPIHNQLNSNTDIYFIKSDEQKYRDEKEFRLICAIDAKPNKTLIIEHSRLKSFIVDKIYLD